MNIESVDIDWGADHDGAPNVRVTVDKLVDTSSMPHTKHNVGRDVWLYLALEDGVGHFLVSNNDKRGYAGRVFDLTMQNGTTEAVKGPWSSGTYFVNSFMRDDSKYEWLVETHIKEAQEKYPDMYYHGIYLTKHRLDAHMPSGVTLQRVERFGINSIEFIPQWDRAGPKPDAWRDRGERSYDKSTMYLDSDTTQSNKEQ